MILSNSRFRRHFVLLEEALHPLHCVAQYLEACCSFNTLM